MPNATKPFLFPLPFKSFPFIKKKPIFLGVSKYNPRENAHEFLLVDNSNFVSKVYYCGSTQYILWNACDLLPRNSTKCVYAQINHYTSNRWRTNGKYLWDTKNNQLNAIIYLDGKCAVNFLFFIFFVEMEIRENHRRCV